MIVVALALLAAISYGAADFCGGLASRRSATIAVVVWSQAAGLIALVPALPFLGGIPSGSDIAWASLCGVSSAGAILLLYRGLAIGTMGVVSPITALLAAVLPVIFAIARGERPSTLVLGGIVAALVAVVCISAAPGESGAATRALPRTSGWPPGMLEAFGAGALFGLLFIALAQTRAAAGVSPLLVARAVAVTIVGGSAAIAGRGQLRFARGGLGIIALAGSLDMAANVLYVVAAHRGGLAIAAVLTSLYPAATVALAAIVLRERLGRRQWVGVAIALIAVVAITTK